MIEGHYIPDKGIASEIRMQAKSLCAIRLSKENEYLGVLEAYSAAGEIGFSWWLVEHYLPYHVNCPNSCDSGEPTRGRKDPPYFQVGYGSLDNIPDLVDSFVEAPLPA